MKLGFTNDTFIIWLCAVFIVSTLLVGLVRKNNG